MVFDGLLMVSVAVSVSHKPSLDLGVFPSIFLNFGEFRPQKDASSQGQYVWLPL